MALYIPHNIFHLARLLYVRPENFGPSLVCCDNLEVNPKFLASRKVICNKFHTEDVPLVIESHCYLAF